MSLQRVAHRGTRRFQLGSSIIPASDLTATWVAQVVLNGGATPSIATQVALSDLWKGLVADGISGKILCLNGLVPDNSIACRTPLFRGASNILWALGAGSITGVTSAGIQFAAGANGLDTGFLSTTFPSNTSVGLALYISNTPGNSTGANTYDFGLTNNSGGAALTLSYARGSVNKFPEAGCFDLVGGSGDTIGSAQLTAGGFLSYQRTAANATALYFANSSTAFASVGTSATSGGTNNPFTMALGCGHLTDSATFGLGPGNTYSFCAMTTGMTSAQTQALFNRVQSYRSALGGGFV